MQGGPVPELDELVDTIVTIETGTLHAEGLGRQQFPPGWAENSLQFDPLGQHRDHRNQVRRVAEPDVAAQVRFVFHALFALCSHLDAVRALTTFTPSPSCRPRDSAPKLSAVVVERPPP